MSSLVELKLVLPLDQVQTVLDALRGVYTTFLIKEHHPVVTQVPASPPPLLRAAPLPRRGDPDPFIGTERLIEMIREDVSVRRLFLRDDGISIDEFIRKVGTNYDAGYRAFKELRDKGVLVQLEKKGKRGKHLYKLNLSVSPNPAE